MGGNSDDRADGKMPAKKMIKRRRRAQSPLPLVEKY